jgi:uncharacterized protein YraI
MLRTLVRIGAVVILIALAVGVVQAQPLSLVYGDRVLGEIKDTAPQEFYTFAGTQGDLITAYVASTTTGMTPTLGLNGPSGQQLAFSTSDPFSPIPDAARISLRLPETGTYTIQVGALFGATGGYFMSLDGSAAVTDSLLLGPSPADVSVDPEAPVILMVQADPTAPVTLYVSGAGYAIEVRDPDGALVALFLGTGIDEAALTLAAGEGLYQVTVSAIEEATTVTLSTGGPVSPDVPGPVATEEAAPPPPPSADVCSVTGSNVNVRSGPGTNYGIVGSLNSPAPVTGQTNTGWWRIDLGGLEGFVFSQVVTAAGPCGAVPLVEGPPPPPPVATEEVGGPAITPTPSPTQPGSPTEPPTQPPAQEAPTDTDPWTFNLDRDDGGIFTEVISYPTGDRIDRIITSINLDQPNPSRTVDFILSCNGTGSENVRFTRQSPNAQQYTCGQTITWRYAAPNNSMPFYAFFLEGTSGGYVSYTLTAIVTGP